MSFKSRIRRGFSLVEILMVVIIVALLATMTFPLYAALRAKAGLAGCLSNMRIIGLGLNGYMQDHNMVWPQAPAGYFNGDSQQLATWWKDTLEPYGVADKHWICPSDAARNDPRNMKKGFSSSYGVTPFDDLPNTAFRWKLPPWAMEHSGFHGARGPNMLMADGTIQEGVSLSSTGAQ